MPLVACNAGDVQIQVVTRSVVEKRGPLDEEMSDLGRERDQGHPCRPRAARGPRTIVWAIFFHHHPGQPDMRPFVSLSGGSPYIQHMGGRWQSEKGRQAVSEAGLMV